jgi:hypothetical protein
MLTNVQPTLDQFPTDPSAGLRSEQFNFKTHLTFQVSVCRWAMVSAVDPEGLIFNSIALSKQVLRPRYLAVLTPISSFVLGPLFPGRSRGGSGLTFA